jgi:hypothetical protein
MVPTFITYDLNEYPEGIHLKVKTELIQSYSYSSKSSNGIVNLPNTFLIKQNISPAHAISELRSVVAKHKGTLEKAYAAAFENGTAQYFEKS